MENLNWNKLSLKRNPFNIIPDRDSKDLIWAGFQANKQKFDDIIKRSIEEDNSKLILNITRFGGGKTHSTFFYSKKENLPKSTNPNPLNLIIIAPKRGEEAAWEFYTKIVEEIGISNLSECVKHMRKDNPNVLKQLQSWTRSEDLGRIIWLLADEDDKTSFAAEQLILGGNATASIKNNLRVRRGMHGISDIAQLLSAFIRILSTYSESGKLEKSRKVFIWLDELESLVYYTSKQYRPFTQTIREFIDSTPNNLVLIMNFSFSEPNDVQNLEIVIGGALLDRVSEKFVFEEADIQDSKQYVADLFKHYRIDNFKGNKYSPFTEESLEVLLKKAPMSTERPLLPRTINKWCLYAINKAFESSNGNLDNISKEEIESLSFIDEVFE